LNLESPSSEPRVAAFEPRTEWPPAALAIAFLVAYAWPILRPPMPPAFRATCRATNIAIWVVFGVEFLIRAYLAR
jgi:voltage-gated potassium channel